MRVSEKSRKSENQTRAAGWLTSHDSPNRLEWTVNLNLTCSSISINETVNPISADIQALKFVSKKKWARVETSVESTMKLEMEAAASKKKTDRLRAEAEAHDGLLKEAEKAFEEKYGKKVSELKKDASLEL